SGHVFCCFVFQAEDGIRDFHVTGVQTCALPILSIFSVTSSASAFLTSTPALAPRPVPTMIDIGVARPSAHGRAMISTETAATSEIGRASCRDRGENTTAAQSTQR